MDSQRPTPAPREPLDDGTLGAIVRDVVDDWRMPPQRLDEVTWRDRVGRSRASWNGGRSRLRWTRRLLGAAGVAVVLTVSLSLAAVWLTARPDRGAASGPSATPGQSPGTTVPPSPGPSGSALPRLLQVGDLPSPATIMVGSGGRFRVADLATGTLGPAVIGASTGPSTVLARPGGGWVCICGDWTQVRAGGPNGLRLTLDAVDATGAPVERRVLKELTGTYDPDTEIALQLQLVDATVTPTADGRFAFIGTSYRDGAAGWVIGVDVLDLSTLQISASQGITLAEPMAVDGRTRSRLAPLASLSALGATLLVSSVWFVDTGPTGAPAGGTDHWTATLVDGAINPGKAPSALVPAGSSSWAECREFEAGAINKDTYWAKRVCGASPGRLELARIDVDGTTVDSGELPPADSAEGASLTAQTADAVFVWNPVEAIMTRYDFETGELTTRRVETAAVPQDVLGTMAMLGRRLGSWIAPSIGAKILLQPGLVASPDGTRVYGLGVASAQDGLGGSTGVFAFEAATLEPVGHWAATADLSSIAISADGRYLFAGAAGGIDAQGHDAPQNGASITVYDTTDGSVRLLAGQLETGTADLWFTQPTCR